MSNAPESSLPPDQQALLEAVNAVLLPLARLVIARGLTYGAVEESLRIAFVSEARAAALRASPEALPHRLVSRISTATGLNRREVTRLINSDLNAEPQRRTPALEAHARWVSDKAYVDKQGRPIVLPRSGPAPSFDSLAQSITKDVHPRSILDDLVRLGLVTWDTEADAVTLLRDRFVPDEDAIRMTQYVGYNVGDHLRAAVSNVNGDGDKMLEQSILATGMRLQDLKQLDQLARAQWQAAVSALVPHLSKSVDEASDSEATARLRFGMYLYAEATPSNNDSDKGV
ncbi:DUF6502 family protein [Ideonella sp.]|jgi:hypothetical protein|uniref:DUF6502 family protein n=1 Tax=Ideonella sp. TaxID=1929293 RepID=UPI0037BF97DE